MVKHGSITRSHVYEMLSSKDARVRRAAFTLLEASNPRLRRNSELFIEIVRFIWDANPNYDVYREFTKRHFFGSTERPFRSALGRHAREFHDQH